MGLSDTQNIDISIGDFYSCASIPELYTDFSAFLLTNALYDPDMVPYIWIWLDKASIPEKEGRFPSWVPDLHHWTHTINHWSVIFPAANEQRNYRASRQSKAIRKGCQCGELKISGRIFDSVVGVFSPRPMSPEEFTTDGHVVQWWINLSDWEDKAACFALSGTETSLDDFCHTLVGGQSYPDKGFDPCQMHRNFRDSVDKWKRVYVDLRIEERYGSPLFIRNSMSKLTSKPYQVDW
jgi:hypothetical protein